MPEEHIVRGQRVNPVMLQRAKKMRRNMTPAEKALWEHLRANRLDGWHFRRQQIIGSFIVDFYCHKADLVIEVDGLIHEYQRKRDTKRDIFLESRGLHVMRIKNQEVEDALPEVLKRIRDYLNEG